MISAQSEEIDTLEDSLNEFQQKYDNIRADKIKREEMNKQSSLNIFWCRNSENYWFILKLLPLIIGSEDVSQFIDAVSHTK
mgnify:CR=1 FL=1